MSELSISALPEIAINSYLIDESEIVWFNIEIINDGRRWTVSHRYNDRFKMKEA